MSNSITRKLHIIAHFNDSRMLALSLGLNFILIVSKLPIPERIQVYIADISARALIAGVKIARRLMAR